MGNLSSAFEKADSQWEQIFKLAEIYKYYFSSMFLPKPQMKMELNMSSDNIV